MTSMSHFSVPNSIPIIIIIIIIIIYSLRFFHIRETLLFSNYFRSADPHVVSIASGVCNQSSSALFYIVFKLLYLCVNVVFKAGKSSSSLFP